jgi:hypothetical protein
MTVGDAMGRILVRLADGELTEAQALTEIIALGVDPAFAREEIAITLGGTDCVIISADD